MEQSRLREERRLKKEEAARRKAIAEVVPDKIQSVPKKLKMEWKDRKASEVLDGENYNFEIDLSDSASIVIRDMKNKTIDIRIMYHKDNQTYATRKGLMVPFGDEDTWNNFVEAITSIDIDELNS